MPPPLVDCEVLWEGDYSLPFPQGESISTQTWLPAQMVVLLCKKEIENCVCFFKDSFSFWATALIFRLSKGGYITFIEFQYGSHRPLIEGVFEKNEHRLSYFVKRKWKIVFVFSKTRSVFELPRSYSNLAKVDTLPSLSSNVGVTGPLLRSFWKNEHRMFCIFILVNSTLGPNIPKLYYNWSKQVGCMPFYWNSEY